MRVRLEATPDELREKGPLLVETLARSVRHANPELAAALSKAIAPETVTLRHRALQELKERTDAAYKAQMKKMVTEIGAVLDGGVVSKSLESETSASAQEDRRFDTEAIQELTIRIDELFRSQAKVEGQLESLEKTQPAAKSIDGLVKALLVRRGYAEADFLEGGALAGRSPAELLGLALARDPVTQVIQKAEPLPPALAPIVNLPAPLIVNEPMQVPPIPDALVKAIERLAAAADKPPFVIQKADPPPVQKSGPLEVTFNRDENGRITGAILKPRS